MSLPCTRNHQCGTHLKTLSHPHAVATGWDQMGAVEAVPQTVGTGLLREGRDLDVKKWSNGNKNAMSADEVIADVEER